jgi:hypothetical protein
MIRTHPLTDTHKRFIPKLKVWLEGYTTDSVWVRGGRIRDRVFFMDLIRKAELLGEYDDMDRRNLQWITEEYMGRLEVAKCDLKLGRTQEYIVKEREAGGSTINKP